MCKQWLLWKIKKKNEVKEKSKPKELKKEKNKKLESRGWPNTDKCSQDVRERAEAKIRTRQAL